MKTYKVKIKNGTRAETIKASSELGAKFKYCQKKGLNYRVFAGKLEAARAYNNAAKQYFKEFNSSNII